MLKLRRLFVCMMFLGCLLSAWPGKVEAQCTGYTVTGTSVNILSPVEAAAQGYTTGTITITTGGGVPSHNVSATMGTNMNFTVSSHVQNETGAYAQAYITQGSYTGPLESWPLNGTINWTSQSWAEGPPVTWHLIIHDGNGNTTTDRVTLTTIDGNTQNPPLPQGYVISYDGVHLNAYYQLVSTFGGGSMMNNCSECQGGETQPCLQATHTPSFDSTVTNPATGETYTLSNVSAGNVAKATESVSGTAYTVPVSFLPGDSPTGSTTNKIYCTMFGYVLAEQWNPGIPETEFAITAVEVIPSTCTLVLRFFEEMGDGWGVQCNVAWKKPPATADRCSAASQIPDFNPGAVWDEQSCATPGNCGTADLPPPNGPNKSFPKYYFAGARGIRFAGPPSPGEPDPIINGGAHNWIFPWYVAQGYIPGGPNANWWSIFLNLAIPKGTGLPIDCKNKDKGTSPIPVPF